MSKHKSISILLLFVLFAVSAGNLSAASGEGHSAGSDEGFDTKTFILEHIKDHYEWHILTWKGKHVSIPLPVILYSKYTGLHTFMSSQLHHGEVESPHSKLTMMHEGKYKGKIVEEFTPENLTAVLQEMDEEEFAQIINNLNDTAFAKNNREALMASFQSQQYSDIVAQFGDKQFFYRPTDLSITKNVVGIWVSILVLVLIFTSISRSYKRREGKAPKGLQSFLEPLILFIRDDVARSAIGEKHYERYLPFLLTLFFFIFLNNLMGLVPIFPGGANITGNITVTMVMALFTFIITTVSGNKHYWKHIFNTPGVPWWLKIPVPLMPLVEFSGIFIKPFVLMIRLFANITAGHIIALGFFSLIFIFGQIHPAAGYGVSIISLLFTVFMLLLELLVAFIQAYVFTLLSALYFGMAIEEEH